MSLDALFDLTDTSDPLLEAVFGGVTAGPKISIYGDVDDQLRVTDIANFVDQNTTVQDDDGRTLNVYNYVGGAGVEAIVAVDDDVTVSASV